MPDFLVSMALRAVNDVTPVLTEINAQLDVLKANMKSLGMTTKAVDTKSVEAMAPALAGVAKQSEAATTGISKMGGAWEQTASGLVVPAGVTALAPNIQAATKETKNLQQGMGGAGNATKNVAIQVAETKKGLTALSHLGMGLTVAGGILGYGVTKGLEMAGEFQSTLVTIQDTTGATTKQMQALSDTIMQTSANVSRFSDLEVAGFAQQLASGGFNNPKTAAALLMPMTQFADAQMYENKVGSGSDAVNMAINMAHLMGHYDPKSLLKSLDTFNKYSVMEPGSSDDLFQTLKYLAPTAKRSLHMDEASVMQMAALANRVGLTGSHGGTNAADMILRLIPGYVRGMGGKPSPSVMAAMQQLGMVNSTGQSQFFNKKGQIVNFQKLIQTLVEDGKKFNPEQLTKLYGHIFGIQGGRAATIFADPQVLQQLKGMEAQLKHTKSIAQIQRDQQNSPAGQLNQLRSNSMTAMIRIAMQLGAAMNPFLHALNRVLVLFLQFEKQHPKILKYVAVFAAIAAGVLLTVGPMLMLVAGVGKLALFLNSDELAAGVRIIKQISGATKIWAAVQWVLNGAMDANPIAITILAVAALIPLVILLITHWKQVVHWLKSLWTWYQNLGDKVKWAIAIFAPFIGLPLLIISKWQVISTFFTKLWTNTLKPILDGLGHLASGAGGWILKHVLGISGGSPAPALAPGAGGRGRTTVIHQYYIKSTDPKGTANEIRKTQDKYTRSRYPFPVVR